jgi:hypothetical protein
VAMMCKVYCHIGNPKAYSTSIQAYLSEGAKSTINYLGFNPQNAVDGWYIDPFISDILNVDLRYLNRFYFQEKKQDIQLYFEKMIEKSRREKKDLWISSENLSTRFILEDLDPFEKFYRLQEVMPKGVVFVIFFRNIWHSLISIYKEYVKNGYIKDFDFFCEETYLFRKCNFLISLLPFKFLTELRNQLIRKNQLIHFIISEEENCEEELLNFLNSLTEMNKQKFPRLNQGENFHKTEALRTLNARSYSNLDGTGLVEKHRFLWSKRNTEDQAQVYGKLSPLRFRRVQLNSIDIGCQISNYALKKTRLLRYLLEIDDPIIEKWHAEARRSNIA